MESSSPVSAVPSTVTVKAITPESLETLKAVITKNMGNLIFRRVYQVVAKKEHLIETVVTRIIPSPANGETPIPQGTPVSVIYKAGTPLPSFTPKEYDQNVEEKYSRFYFFTADIPLRDNDRQGKIALFGASNKYSQIDFTNNMDFRFSYNNEDRTNLVPPRVGDLVCGVVAADKHQRKNPAYKFWFTCSEQFLHAWTAIKYAEHETLDKFITRPTTEESNEAQIRKSLFRGNKLCTNSYRKWMRTNVECNIAFDQTEAEKRYYSLRCERTAVNWVHMYAALVLILRYREVPNKDNVPYILDGGASPKTWDLPHGWMDRFVEKYGLIQVDEERKVYISPIHAPRRSTNGEVPKSTSIPIVPRMTVGSTKTPSNTPTISAPIMSYIKSGGRSYTPVEFVDEVVMLPPSRVVAPTKDKKIDPLDFPPLPWSGPAVKAFMPIGAWADDEIEEEAEVEEDIEEDEVEEEVEEDIQEDGDAEEVQEDDTEEMALEIDTA